MNSVPSPTQVGGLIPHFFYDVIGRMVPGGFAILGFGAVFGIPSLPKAIDISQLPPAEKTAGLYLFVVTAALLLFALAAYFVGFLLGAPSHWVFEKKLRKMWCLGELNLEFLLKSFGGAAHEGANLKKVFKERFDFELAEPAERHSWLCAYSVWVRNVNLGQMASRWDAEALGSRGILLGGICLFFIRLIQQARDYCRAGDFEPWLLAFFAGVSIAAWLAYEYHRRKQLYGRYALFEALESLTQKADQVAHPSTIPARS